MLDTRQAVMAFLLDICPNDPARAGLTEDTQLMEQGIIDSFGVVRLVQFLEETFDIRVPDTDIVPDMFASGTAIISYVERVRAGAGLPVA